jgi:hypothetical protein
MRIWFELHHIHDHLHERKNVQYFRLSDYWWSDHFFLTYRTIGISIIGLANEEIYRIIGYRFRSQVIELSDIWQWKIIEWRLFSSGSDFRVEHILSARKNQKNMFKPRIHNIAIYSHVNIDHHFNVGFVRHN